MVYQPPVYKIFTRECNIKPCITGLWYLGHNTAMPLWQFTIGSVILYYNIVLIFMIKIQAGCSRGRTN